MSLFILSENFPYLITNIFSWWRIIFDNDFISEFLHLCSHLMDFIDYFGQRGLILSMPRAGGFAVLCLASLVLYREYRRKAYPTQPYLLSKASKLTGIKFHLRATEGFTFSIHSDRLISMDFIIIN